MAFEKYKPRGVGSDMVPSIWRPLQSLLFRYIPLKIYGLPNFYMVFQFLLKSFCSKSIVFMLTES